jgi:hypothetical protein
VRIDWFIIAIPAPVPTVQFPTPPVALTVMRRAAELCRTTSASCCSSSASDGPVLGVGLPGAGLAGAGLAGAGLAGAGLAASGGGVLALALAGLIPS